MPRTQAEIDYANELAARIDYIAPLSVIEPAGLLGEDRAWNDVVAWFDEHTRSWSAALLVYISRRYDQSITEAYAATDTWRKHEFDRRERLADPDAVVSYN